MNALRPTRERLADALLDAGAPELAERARRGEYSDFESEHVFPKMVLVEHLRQDRSLRACEREHLIERVQAGHFDDSLAEGIAWSQSPEGQSAYEDAWSRGGVA